MRIVILAALLALGAPSAAYAGKADVLAVKVRAGKGNTWSFDVTIKHADSGWKHYADGVEVLGPDRTMLGRRTLYHPHVNEQPFTRSLDWVIIPEGIGRVRIRAHDLVHGFGGREMEVELKNSQ